MPILLKRAYAPPAPDDGQRVLVDRVWPRGRSREVLALDAWHPELGPSDELRRWFGHDPVRWDDFRRRYEAELRAPGCAALLDELARAGHDGTLTLVYGARDEEHNQAVVLRAVLERRSASR